MIFISAKNSIRYGLRIFIQAVGYGQLREGVFSIATILPVILCCLY